MAGKDIGAALRAIKQKQAAFVSRGDRSGTHAAELALWQAAGIDIGRDKARWYREVGQGMGAALNMASASDAYVLRTAAPGYRSGTAAASASWWKAMPCCSINTA